MCVFFSLVSFQSDSVSYFFDEIERIAKSNYVPSQKDILHCRKATKGVYEFTIRIKVSARKSIVRKRKANARTKMSDWLIFCYCCCCRIFHLYLWMWVDNEHNGKNGRHASVRSLRYYSLYQHQNLIKF